MASISKRVAAAIRKDFIDGTIFRVDLDRVDVAPAGSAGILRSLPLTGDRDKVKPGDPVRIVNIAGERVALLGDAAVSDAAGIIVEDASQIELAEAMALLPGTPSIIGTGGSTADHGMLFGLGDDDHPQYLTEERHDLTAKHPLGTVVPHDTLDGLLDPAASKNFTMVNKNLKFTFDAPQSDTTYGGGLDLEVNGAFTGNLLHVHQPSGTPAVGSIMTLMEAAHANVTPLRLKGTGMLQDWVQATTTVASMSSSGTLIAGHVRPRVTDSYDLGTYNLSYKQAFISQINSTLFVEQTQTLLGGWLTVTKDQGDLGSSVTAAATSVNFGKAMTPGDIVVIKATDSSGTNKVEYMQVGTLVTGTTYNVTRDLAAMHTTDPAWYASTPFAVLGTTNDGRIELNAYDTPRMSMYVKNGTAYNAEKEYIRLGDMNGWQGSSGSGYGIGMGDVAGNKYLSYTPTGGLTVRGKIQADEGYLGTLTVQGLLALNSSGELRAGDTTNGIRLGYLTDGYYLRGMGSGKTQVELKASNGKLTAGNGCVVMDETGLALNWSNALDPDTTKSHLKLQYGGQTMGEIYGFGDSIGRALTFYAARAATDLNVQIAMSAGAAQSVLIQEPDWYQGGLANTTRFEVTADQTRIGRLSLKYADWNGNLAGDGGAAIVSDSNAFKRLMILGNTSEDGVKRKVKVWDHLEVSENLFAGGSATVTGALTAYGTTNIGGDLYANNGLIRVVNRNDPSLPPDTYQYIFGNDYNVFYRNHKSGVYESPIPMGVMDLNLDMASAYLGTGSATRGNFQQLPVVVCPGTNWEFADWTMMIPNGWYNRTWYVTLWWMPLSSTGSATLFSEIRAIRDGQPTTTTSECSSYLTVTGTANVIKKTVFSFTGLAYRAQAMHIRVGRHGSYASDTMAANVYLYAAKISCHPFYNYGG